LVVIVDIIDTIL